jgi:thioredoxin-related protein
MKRVLSLLVCLLFGVILAGTASGDLDRRSSTLAVEPMPATVNEELNRRSSTTETIPQAKVEIQPEVKPVVKVAPKPEAKPVVNSEVIPMIAPIRQAFQNVNYDTALIQALQEKKVVMLDFTTTWCGYCRLLDQNTFSQSGVRKFLSEQTVAIKVDGDREAALKTRYNVSAFPTLVFVNSQGTEVGRIVGYLSADQFLQQATGYALKK